jgi:hypothetical protein
MTGVVELVRIDADDDHGYGFASLEWVGIRGGQSDFKYTSQQLVVTPLCSHTANADRRGDTPLPGSTRTAGDRNYPSHSLRPATTRYRLQFTPTCRDSHKSRNFNEHQWGISASAVNVATSERHALRT